jgi:hypothetical protein
MRGVSRREFGWLAAGVGVLGLGAAGVACGPSTPPEQTETATPGAGRPDRADQADAGRFEPDHR